MEHLEHSFPLCLCPQERSVCGGAGVQVAGPRFSQGAISNRHPLESTRGDVDTSKPPAQQPKRVGCHIWHWNISFPSNRSSSFSKDRQFHCYFCYLLLLLLKSMRDIHIRAYCGADLLFRGNPLYVDWSLHPEELEQFWRMLRVPCFSHWSVFHFRVSGIRTFHWVCTQFSPRSTKVVLCSLCSPIKLTAFYPLPFSSK